ncbi:hypothetical protein CBM2637_B50020 [Cupriavidus taiwanensis]|nr:hypothetical protein CBM2637_B50020 [Cupriavidus taiwanensis]
MKRPYALRRCELSVGSPASPLPPEVSRPQCVIQMNSHQWQLPGQKRTSAFNLTTDGSGSRGVSGASRPQREMPKAETGCSFNRPAPRPRVPTPPKKNCESSDRHPH